MTNTSIVPRGTAATRMQQTGARRRASCLGATGAATASSTATRRGKEGEAGLQPRPCRPIVPRPRHPQRGQGIRRRNPNAQRTGAGLRPGAATAYDDGEEDDSGEDDSGEDDGEDDGDEDDKTTYLRKMRPVAVAVAVAARAACRRLGKKG